MKKHFKRLKNRNRHHLIPKSRGGEMTEENLLLMKVERHEAWHKIFGLMTVTEVLRLLQRVVRQKDKDKKGGSVWLDGEIPVAR